MYIFKNLKNLCIGRAGRYGSAWETGYVTTYKSEDLATLKTLLAKPPEPVTQAGLHPTAEQMELYAYHLPHATLSSLMVRNTVIELTCIKCADYT